MISPSVLDLTTLQNVKNWASVGSSFQPNNADDDNIQSCITALSVDFLRRTGKISASGQLTTSPMVQAVTYSDRYDGSGTDTIWTRVSPIISASLVQVDGVAIPQSPDGVQPGWVISMNSSAISIVGAVGANQRGYYQSYNGYNRSFGSRTVGFRSGIQNVRVDYTAGYQASVLNELQNIPSTSPYVVTVAFLPWISDISVIRFIGGTKLVKTSIAPNVGEYFLQGGGQYLFNSADASAQILISYNPSGTPADVEFAVRKWVHLNYRRKEWTGIVTKSSGVAGAGATTYLQAEMTKDIERVILDYTRRAIV